MTSPTYGDLRRRVGSAVIAAATMFAALVLPGAPAGPTALQMQQRLKTTILPEVRFDKAPLKTVLKALRRQTKDADGQGRAISFLLQAPRALANRPVTVDLDRVSVEGVLSCICLAAGLEYRVEPYAVVLYPAPPHR